MDTTRDPGRGGWTALLRRRWVQLVIAATAGFALGAAGATGGTAEPAAARATIERPAPAPAPVGHSDEDLDAAVSEALEAQAAEHADELAEVATEAAAALSAADEEARRTQRAAVKAAVAKAKQQVRRAQARQERRASPPAAAPPAPTTDPRFSYCYEAQAAGYGPYVRGVDPEYDWYRDNDGDGTVCE